MLGANDGIVSTASLVVGSGRQWQSARHPGGGSGRSRRGCALDGRRRIRIGEPQADTERADLNLSASSRHQPEAEEDELAAIYVRAWSAPELARTVARQLMVKDALGAHPGDELGLDGRKWPRGRCRPRWHRQPFAVGGGLPILTIALSPTSNLTLTVPAVSLVCPRWIPARFAARAEAHRHRLAPAASHSGALPRWR